MARDVRARDAMKRAALVMAIAACGGAGATPDAGGDPNDLMDCMVVNTVASCEGTDASTTIDFGGGSTSLTLCHAAPVEAGAMCGQCAVNAYVDENITDQTAHVEVADFVDHPEVLCAETPEAKVGDACAPPVFSRTSSFPYETVSGDLPCLPTRAHVNADGTVAGQDYLVCDGGAGRCVASLAPTIEGYLEKCAPATLAKYGATGAVGVVDLGAGNGSLGSTAPEACLIAWDSTTQAPASGMTIECIGDWECPAGALCDDQVPALDAPHPIAVCKPGPRGTLTPAMLTP